ncbi:glucose-6-phosphate isomerase [Rhodococcus rhodochrous]|uniref:Glucose-6-phosphate isomerase n=1 Tax=Rhodococcus rhodochrous TaxID=1829 RepID=A0AA46WUL0_RHORH|nr:glucose-6-phosphate isomerase [Rhodococcus rhodochrous]MCB8910444.1 glucose-6-phosphate isomerase [Rhodococcus rhodochrous]TWH62876.1 glucose-6-phosphate isomerase [Rhodococcus rhodochrous J38]UZF44643.1 glucose-6-phosphate isomerase [Rhodococcus rhodochrous]
MDTETRDVTTTEAWRALETHRDEIAAVSLRELFAIEPQRAQALTAHAGDLVVDFSKQRLTARTLELLLQLAEQTGVATAREAMLSGEHINVTEDRAVLHTALRLPRDAELVVDGVDVVADVHTVLDRMGEFTDRLRTGDWRGATGQKIATVVNIGIGGSDLGPAMVTGALRRFHDGPAARFVSNVDPADLTAALADLDPATTLFIVASKTFSTLETLSNATAARRWLVDVLGEDAVAKHFVAVSTHTERVVEFGIDPANMFEFWDWVGGRYSVDSAIGLAVMCAIGKARFAEFLAGMHAIDEHFATAAPAQNAPLLAGLIGVWNASILGHRSRAVVPYAQDLARLPAYLQQLTMESNGKSVRADGTPVSCPTGEVFWGEPGTNGQHAFFQLLHQGTEIVPVDFLGLARSGDDLPARDGQTSMQVLVLANMFAQAKVLAFGRDADEVRAEGVDEALVAHKVMPGNRPSTTILAPELTPSVVGQIIAFYEHQTFVQGVVWGIDSFDQWGVELGKTQATALQTVLAGDESPDTGDASTDHLIEIYRTLRDGGR